MSPGRVLAIVGTDVRVRFRRVSTLVVFLFLSGLPYLWIPDPSTGRALLQSGGRRVLYDSAAIGMATAVLATVTIGLFGFYVISNAVKRDVRTRCGFVVASTRVTSGEYLAGKFLGNLLFLAAFVAGFLVTSMAMQVVRGEAPLRPFVFVEQYLLLVPPAIVLVSVLAIVFESVPWLSGRFGDVVYFFLWTGSLGVVAAAQDQGGGIAWLAAFDHAGFGYVLATVQQTLHTSSFSIGASAFDPGLGTIVFPGMLVSGGWVLARAACVVTPLPLLLIGRWRFHRFDPARLRRTVARGHRGLVVRLNGWMKPLARRATGLLPGGGSSASLLGAARVDALLTLSHLPLLLPALAAFAIAALVADASPFVAQVFPAGLLALAIALSDVATRDRTSGALSLVMAAPRLREGYARWKLASALWFGLAFLAIPLARFALARPGQLPGAVVGVVFVCSAATALGILTGNPKAFLVLFLSFSYAALNDRGRHPALDFGGFVATTPWTVPLGYAAASVVLALLADRWHRSQLSR